MTDLGPTEFSHLTGLSVKALRLYAERGLLVPTNVDRASGYRRYSHEQLAEARRISLLRRAGIGLADIRRFLAAPASEVLAGWMGEVHAEADRRAHALAAVGREMGLTEPPRGADMTMTVVRPMRSEEDLIAAWTAIGGDPADDRRLADLRRALIEEPHLLLGAYQGEHVVGAALGFTRGAAWATLRALGLVEDTDEAAAELLAAFEAAAQAAGAEGVALGGAAERDVAFYVARGYRTQLLLQWVHDPTKFEEETRALLAGPLNGMEHSMGDFGGVPQLFVVLDEPDATTRSVVADQVDGAHVSYCMFRALSPRRRHVSSRQTGAPSCEDVTQPHTGARRASQASTGQAPVEARAMRADRCGSREGSRSHSALSVPCAGASSPRAGDAPLSGGSDRPRSGGGGGRVCGG